MNLFGTDGIRGKYGEGLTDDTAYLLGSAIVRTEGPGVIVVGRDTRISGVSITEALVKGINDFGGQVINLGVIPTNAVAHFVRKAGALFGVMVSASHNPPEYNGLKVFDRYGVKICETKQIELSNLIVKNNVKVMQSKSTIPTFSCADNVYASDVCNMAKVCADGLKIALDCCFGSAYGIAKKIFSQIGASVVAYCDFNRGEMINVNCGATNPEFLKNLMKTNNCDLGFAFDGDADRLAVLERDVVLSPDRILYAFAKYFKSKGILKHNAVVGTIMTDCGLEKSLNKLDIQLHRTDVGDSKIFELMTQHGFNLGGENSGHYLLSDFATGSDALINALIVTKIFVEEGSLISYTKEYKPYCNTSKNILTDERILQSMKDADSLKKIEEQFIEKFPTLRLVIRFSGTESKIRLYVEGKNANGVKSAMEYVIEATENIIMQFNN